MSHKNGSSNMHVLEYGREEIPYELKFSERKRLTIHVEPDQSVQVLAPTDTSMEKVKARLQRRAGWIARQRRYFEEFIPPPPPKRFVAGETHRYLGRQYRLSFERGESKAVKLRGRYFEILSPSRPSSAEVEGLLDAWYRERAHALLRRKVEDALKSSYLRRVNEPALQVRRMKRRWGSCTQSGDVIFNLSLIKAPLECIEYVVVHELCHLKVHDHSRKYYDLLTKCLPDWERRKKRLNSQDWALS
jgi:predicted metal-dependent hydrolase